MATVKNNILNKVKIILEDKNVNDELLNIYIENAIDYIKDYTLLNEIPHTLQSVIVEMTVYQYRQREVENVISEGMGSMRYSFVTSYPDNIINRLNTYRRVRVM